MNAGNKSRPHSLWLDLQLGPGIRALPIERGRARRLALAALHCDAALTLRFVGRDEGRSLNRQFRQRDRATNVLTFPYELPGRLHADIVLCTPVIRDEARAQGKRFDQHLAHLWVHGVLHAQGLDHEQAQTAASMEALEVSILKRFGIADPYQGAA